ncbi:MAG: hypothetical protein DDT26_00210 [Dehalococcoidia bacterium]|nr:hypothetical protein [Chloroflexota bacterium]
MLQTALNTVLSLVVAHQEALIAFAIGLLGWLLSKLHVWQPKKIRQAYKAVGVLHGVWDKVKIEFKDYFNDPNVTWDDYVSQVLDVLREIDPTLAAEADTTVIVAEVTKELIAEG